MIQRCKGELDLKRKTEEERKRKELEMEETLKQKRIEEERKRKALEREETLKQKKIEEERKRKALEREEMLKQRRIEERKRKALERTQRRIEEELKRKAMKREEMLKQRRIEEERKRKALEREEMLEERKRKELKRIEEERRKELMKWESGISKNYCQPLEFFSRVNMEHQPNPLNPLSSLCSETENRLRKTENRLKEMRLNSESEMSLLQLEFNVCQEMDSRAKELGKFLTSSLGFLIKWNEFKIGSLDLETAYKPEKIDMLNHKLSSFVEKKNEIFLGLEKVRKELEKVKKFYNSMKSLQELRKMEDDEEEWEESAETNSMIGNTAYVEELLKKKLGDDGPSLMNSERIFCITKKYVDLGRRLPLVENRMKEVQQNEFDLVRSALSLRSKSFDIIKSVKSKSDSISHRMNELEDVYTGGLKKVLPSLNDFVVSLKPWKTLFEEIKKIHQKLDECVDPKTCLQKKRILRNEETVTRLHKELGEMGSQIEGLKNIDFETNKVISSFFENEPDESCFEEISSDWKLIIRNGIMESIDQLVQLDLALKPKVNNVEELKNKLKNEVVSVLDERMNGLEKMIQKEKELRIQILEVKKLEKIKFTCVKEYEDTLEETKNTLLVFKSHQQVNRMKNNRNPLRKEIKKLKIEIADASEDNSDEEDDSDEEEEEGEEDDSKKVLLENLRKELEEKEKRSNMIKRRIEKENRRIYILGHKTLKFLRTKLLVIKGGKEDEFIHFLKKTGVYVQRSFVDDYEDAVMLHENQGRVFLAKIKEDDFSEPKIVKVLSANPQSKVAVKNEIQILMKLQQHPSIIRVNHVFVYGKKHDRYICVEMDHYKTDLLRWTKGLQFNQTNSIGEKMTPEILRNMKTVQSKRSIYHVFQRILEGIHFIHSNGIQHRDIKPENVILNNEFEVKIIDFGIAKESSQLTITKISAAATERYLSPWDDTTGLMGDEGYEKRDIFAFGLMLLETLCVSSEKGKECERIPSLLQEYFMKEGTPKTPTSHYDDQLWKILRISDPVVVTFLKLVLEPDVRFRMTAKQALEFGLFHSLSSPSSAVKEIRDQNIQNIQGKLELVRNLNAASNFGQGQIVVKVDRRFEENGSRKNIVHSFLDQSMSCNTLRVLLKPLKCSFEGEGAEDAGGVARELCSLLFEQVTEEYCQEVGTTSRGKYFLPTDVEDHSDLFFLLGRFCLRCLIEQRCFRISFPPFLYCYILDREPKSDDEWIEYCRFVDPSFIPTIEKTLYNTSHFQVLLDYDETFIDEDGNEIRLKETNKNQYLMSKVRSKLRGMNVNGMNRMDKNIDGFRRGFYSLIQEESINLDIRHILNPYELEKMLFGDRSLSSEVMFRNIEYGNGMEKRKEYLERFLSGDSEEDETRRWNFVRFVAGSCDVVDGVLMKDGKPQKIKLRSRDTYFFSHTCFYRLDCGDNYENESYEKFSNELSTAMTTEIMEE